MSKAWMPLYIGDYLADTGHFNATQHGAYLLLMMFYWANGGLPASDESVRMISKLSRQQWVKYLPSLRAKFLNDWKHKRLDAELAKALEKSKVNSANAKRNRSEKSPSQSQSLKEKEKEKEKDAARSANNWRDKGPEYRSPPHSKSDNDLTDPNRDDLKTMFAGKRGNGA